MTDPRASIPSVDRLVASDAFEPLLAAYPRARVVEAARHSVARVRAGVADGSAPGDVTAPATYAALADAWLASADVPSLRAVVNGTGVVLHTNLGRAPLASEAVEAMVSAARDYTNLEYDLEGGERGSRYAHCVSLLTELTGAQDALVVNNAAGALVLALNSLARGSGVAVSRGELVEIGGGFRIPEILGRSGAGLVEVGSTNRTRVADYERALVEDGATVALKVHRSNFRITGFTEDVALTDLSELTRRLDAVLLHDLGSGLLVEASLVHLPGEPTPHDSLAAGADVVSFSGDKLLGGPQAGVILGRGELVARMRGNPLCRALRVDKVTLAGLEATLRLYRDPVDAVARIPTLRMLAAGPEELRARADALVAELSSASAACEVISVMGAVGGGTYPGAELPSWALELSSRSPDAFAAALRDGDPPVVARIVDDRVTVDVRTVLPGQEADLVRRIVEAVERDGQA